MVVLKISSEFQSNSSEQGLAANIYSYYSLNCDRSLNFVTEEGNGFEYVLSVDYKNENPTFILTHFGIFHNSITKPTPTDILIIHEVSLSQIYKKTITDWNTLNKTERTDKPCKTNSK